MRSGYRAALALGGRRDGRPEQGILALGALSAAGAAEPPLHAL
jgi:hypothetical protein